MSAAAASQLKVSHLWQLEKYARLLQEQQHTLLHAQPAKTQGSWKHYCSSATNTIQLSLLEDNHLMISSGSQIYESISLWEAKKWIRGITKGDSALFIYKINNENRRFRVKFSRLSSGGTSTDACKHCSSVLSSLISMSEMPTPTEDSQARHEAEASLSQLTLSQQSSFSQQPVQSSYTQQPPQSYTQQPPQSQPFVMGTNARATATISAGQATTGVVDPKESSARRNSLIPVSEIAKAIQTKGQTLGEAYKSTNFPTGHLAPFVRLCLTDVNFPAFVEAVEKELNGVTKT